MYFLSRSGTHLLDANHVLYWEIHTASECRAIQGKAILSALDSRLRGDDQESRGLVSYEPPCDVQAPLSNLLTMGGEIYDRHTYDAEKRKAMEVWDAELEQILAGKIDKDGKVIDIRQVQG